MRRGKRSGRRRGRRWVRNEQPKRIGATDGRGVCGGAGGAGGGTITAYRVRPG